MIGLGLGFITVDIFKEKVCKITQYSISNLVSFIGDHRLLETNLM